MRAFVYKADERDQAVTGTGRVSPFYKRFKNFHRYYLNRLPKGKYVVMLYHDWSRRYFDPDERLVHTNY
jgi:hypothetical protein